MISFAFNLSAFSVFALRIHRNLFKLSGSSNENRSFCPIGHKTQFGTVPKWIRKPSKECKHFAFQSLNHTAEQDVSKDINVIALVKGEERYVFLFNDETRAETLRTLGRYASNPDMSFSWYDAAVDTRSIVSRGLCS